jgi:integrase
MGGRRTLIAKGIYRDKSGIAIIVSVRGTPREFRRDEKGRAYSTFTKDQLLIERKRIDAREHLKATNAGRKGQSLAADVRAYLHTLSGRTKEDADNLLRHWTNVLGDRDRKTLTAMELRHQAAAWADVAASTFNHRRQALISLYRALDGPAAPNPAREIPKRQELMGAPKALSYDVIAKVLKAMPETQSRARLKLMAYTGLPQMQIEKLTPNDWQGDRLRVTPRRKGAGASGRWLPLAPEAKAAMLEFTRLKCWGPFSRSSLWKAWHAYGPPGTNPYSLRHSWITELYRRSNGDVLALQQLSLHARLDQTQRYAAGALEERMEALVLPRKRATTDPKNLSTSLAFTPPTRNTARGKSQRGNGGKSTKKGRK